MHWLIRKSLTFFIKIIFKKLYLLSDPVNVFTILQGSQHHIAHSRVDQLIFLNNHLENVCKRVKWYKLQSPHLSHMHPCSGGWEWLSFPNPPDNVWQESEENDIKTTQESKRKMAGCFWTWTTVYLAYKDKDCPRLLLEYHVLSLGWRAKRDIWRT